MCSLLFSGPAASGKSSKINALCRLIGRKKFHAVNSYELNLSSILSELSPDTKLIYYDVRDVKEFEKLFLFHASPTRQMLIATNLSSEELAPFAEDLKRNKIRVEYLDAVPREHWNYQYHLIADEWAKTWLTFFNENSDYDESFVVDDRVRQRMQEIKDLFSILSWEKDQDKLLALFMDPITRPLLLEQEENEKNCGREIKQKLFNWQQKRIEQLEKISIPNVLFPLILGYSV